MDGDDQLDGASFRLAGGQTRFRFFDAVGERVADHVFQRRQDVFQQAAFDFDFAAFKDEVDVFADAFRRLFDQATQARFVDVKAHQLRGQQVVLDAALDDALLRREVAQDDVVLAQRVLQVLEVVNGLGELARELLDFGEAVHFQRVEVGVVFALLFATVEHLRFGFAVQTAHLFGDAGGDAGQFVQVEFRFADDVFHARTHDGGLAGHRDHFVKQLRIDADVTRQVVGVAVLVVFLRFRFFLVFFLRLVVAVFDDGFDAFRFAVKAFVFFWRCRRRRDRGFGGFCCRRRAIRRRGRSGAFRVLCMRAVGSAIRRRRGSACSGCGAGRRCRCGCGGRCAGSTAVGIAGGRCFGGSGLRCFALCLLRLFLRLLLRLFAAVWCRFCVVAGFL